MEDNLDDTQSNAISLYEINSKKETIETKCKGRGKLLYQLIDLINEDTCALLSFSSSIFPDFPTNFFQNQYLELIEKIYDKSIKDKNNWLAKYIFRHSLYMSIYYIRLVQSCEERNLKVIHIAKALSAILNSFDTFLDYYKKYGDRFNLVVINKDLEIDFSSSNNMIMDSVSQISKHITYSRKIITFLNLIKNHKNISSIKDKSYNLNSDVSYMNIFKAVYRWDLYYDFSKIQNKNFIKYIIDTDNIFPRIENYRKYYNTVTLKSLSVALFHRLNLLLNIHHAYEQIEEIKNNLNSRIYTYQEVYDELTQDEIFKNEQSSAQVIKFLDNIFLGKKEINCYELSERFNKMNISDEDFDLNTCIEEELVDEIRNLQVINLTDSIFDFINKLYSDEENPFDISFDYESSNIEFLKNPLDIDKPIKDIIVDLANNIEEINPATKYDWEDKFNISDLDRNQYHLKMKKHPFYREILKNYKDDENLEINAYKEFFSSDINEVIKMWIRKSTNEKKETGGDWLYILDIIIICKIFGIDIPGQGGFSKLLDRELHRKEREMFKINIRFNYTFIVWLAYHGEYLEYIKSKN
ncbi:hypothetical protein IB633_08735 [Francisella philomiragia]|uniref:Uncharacterized protein n=1 Tax=Francisella philomiragia subsp. philomiragia (strain ATCC 25017 / CCUG 19701 / FSC 153 / O\|nr:hypothetical protein [Francisella philomiragia]AJI47873.1 hypothetical protein BF30_80 [Francisella philomiragia]AJI49416.1 hypothetical protein KU46_1471 [Francisella philomiragia]MBK2020045.1 hypothetical protein [Francisella philomiragia]MBK2031138.1 hypothetical protein [Francisella philomiragia]MBK2263603.1 hypothetical protein [Francisella philomiragia]